MIYQYHVLHVRNRVSFYDGSCRPRRKPTLYHISHIVDNLVYVRFFDKMAAWAVGQFHQYWRHTSSVRRLACACARLACRRWGGQEMEIGSFFSWLRTLVERWSEDEHNAQGGFARYPSAFVNRRPIWERSCGAWQCKVFYAKCLLTCSYV